MSKKIAFVTANILVMVVLLLVSCGPQAAPTPAPVPVKPSPAAPAPVTPVPAQPAPTIAPENAITVTLKKIDGTSMKKTVEKPKYGGTLNIVRFGTADPVWDLRIMAAAFPATVLSLDRLLLGDWARGPAGTGEFSWQIYEYITKDQFMGGLAESWEMPDDETVIYHLRRGVRWPLDDREASKLVGGREVTADDIVFSFKWLFFSEPRTIISRTFSGWQKADFQAKDKYTVVVKASKLDINQLLGYLSDSTPIIPREVIEKYGTFSSWDKVVGTGPFMIKDFVSGSVATWVKNPTYWGYDPVLGKNYPLPYVDTLKFLQIADQSTAEAAFRTGRLDGPLNLTKEQWQSMTRSYPNTKTKIINFGTNSNRIVFQMTDPKAPWQDIRVRRALMMAINHQEILNTYYGGAADIQAFPLPNAPELYAFGWDIPLKDLPRETQELFEYNPDKAKKLLTEAGYPNGFKTTMMLSSAAAAWLDLGPIVKEYWAKVGVELALDIRDAGVFSGYVSTRKDFPAVTNTGMWGTATQYVWYEGPPGGYNTGNVDDPKLKELRLKMFDVLWDIEKRTPIMKELYKHTISQVWYPSLPSPWNYRVYQPWVKNYDAETSIGNFGQPWQYLWVDQDLKKKLGY